MIEELIEDKDPTVQKRLKEIGFFKKDPILVSDFNHVSQIERAYQLKAIKSAEMYLEKIFTTKDRQQYQNKIMKLLPQILT